MLCNFTHAQANGHIKRANEICFGQCGFNCTLFPRDGSRPSYNSWVYGGTVPQLSPIFDIFHLQLTENSISDTLIAV